MEKSWINKSSAENLEHQTFIENQNQCPLCGTDVRIVINKTDEDYCRDFELKEEAYCPSCQLKTRAKQHCLH